MLLYSVRKFWGGINLNISLVEKDINEIQLIKPLWEKLNLIHFNNSVYFKSKYEKFTFEKRMKSINRRSENGIVKLDVILDNDTMEYMGYCLSSIEDNIGEIESIFIEKQYRRYNLGDKLMLNALNWFEYNSITNIQINVVYANDEAIPFYERYGFYIGNYVLKRIWY